MELNDHLQLWQTEGVFEVGDGRYVYQMILDERMRQKRKFGHIQGNVKSGDMTNPDMTDHYRLAILGEEFGELAKALVEEDGDDHVIEELVQIAAVVTAWIEGKFRKLHRDDDERRFKQYLSGE